MSVEADDMELAIRFAFFQHYDKDLNDLTEYDIESKPEYARFENSLDGSYLEFEVNEVK